MDDATFASSTVGRHLVRGALAVVLIGLALALLPGLGPLTLLLVLPAAVLLRGCPTCWTLGLLQTLAVRDTNRDTARDTAGDTARDTARTCPVPARR